MLDLGVSLDIWPWLWLVLGVVFVLVELTVLGGSLMVLPFGVSALIASLLAFAGISIEIQWAVFGGGGVVLFLLFWRYQSLVQEGNRLPPGVGAVRLVGLTGVVTRTIDPDATDVRGRIVVDGDTWGAVADGTAVLPEGTRVRITDVEGTHVRVEPAEPLREGAPPAVDPRPPDPPPPEAST